MTCGLRIRRSVSMVGIMSNSARLYRLPPDQQYDNCPDHGAEETRVVAGLVESDRLAEELGQHGADNSEHRRQDEATRLGIARSDQLGDHPRNEPDDDRT